MLDRYFVIFESLKPFILLIFPWENAIFYKIVFSAKMLKINAKMLSKPAPDPPKTIRNRAKFSKNGPQNARTRPRRPKNVQQAPKTRKNDEK